MTEERDNALAIAKLKGEITALEERMKAHQAKQEGALDRLRADLAQRDKEAAQQDKDNLRWMVGLALACTTIIIAAIALLAD